MKKLIIIILITPLFLSAQKQPNVIHKSGKAGVIDTVINSTSNSASLGKFYLDYLEVKKSQANPRLDSMFMDEYCIRKIEGVSRVSCLFKLRDESSISELENKGMLVRKRSSLIHTGYIVVDSIHNFINEGSFVALQINHKVEMQMDAARSSSNVDYLQSIQLTTQAYYGQGVVVGVIDGGFDLTHPNFYDETGNSNYRIKKVWDQGSSAGSSPSGFFYGTELTTESSMLTHETDKKTGSHGSHVAGIAAGSGGGANLTYQGVAPKSELVLVGMRGITDVADGIDYIFNYSQSVNKPCVINMSLGMYFGPHDGTSLLDQHIDSKTGAGKIIVGAAGNEGAFNLHLKRVFSSSNSTMYSLIEFPHEFLKTDGNAAVYLSGSSGSTFLVAVNIYNTTTGLIEGYTSYYSSKNGTIVGETIYDGDIFSDKCVVRFNSETSSINNKDAVLIEIDHTAQDDNYRYAMLEIICTNGTVHGWSSNAGEVIFSNGSNFTTKWQDGDSKTTIGEIGGTANEIIAVGAYTTKNNYVDLGGNYQLVSLYNTVGELAQFSSVGPTVDGRIKPDITAPGNAIISSLNSFDANYTASSSSVVSGVTDGSKNWLFGEMSGTSMASPMVTGIVALCLEADPTLTPSQLKNLLSLYSNTDSYTGYSLPDNEWGHGKIDAYKLLKYIEGTTASASGINSSLQLYPNPTTDVIQFTASYEGNYELFNLQGALVSSGNVSKGINVISLQDIPNGMYNISIKLGSVVRISKVIKQ